MKKKIIKIFPTYLKLKEDILNFLKFVYVTAMTPLSHNSILYRKAVLYRDTIERLRVLDFAASVRSVYYGWRFVYKVLFYITITDRLEAKYYDGNDAKFKRDVFQ